jgi:hypothetical protein
MRQLLRLVAVVVFMLAPVSTAWGADALSAFTNAGPTAPFSYGGYNAGPASFSAALDCFGIAGFACRQSGGVEGTQAIGRIATPTDIGAAALDANYLSVLGYSFNGPSVGIFYDHDGSAAVRLKASFKLLANESPDSLIVSIFRERTDFFFPEPSNLTVVTATAANATGSFEVVVSEAGRYGVHVTRVSGLSAPAPTYDQRHDWVGLNLEVLPAVAAVPEPGTWALMIAGFGLVGGLARRRARAVTYA